MDAKFFLKSDAIHKKYNRHEYVPVLLDYEPVIGIILFDQNTEKMVLATDEIYCPEPTNEILFGYIKPESDENITAWLRTANENWRSSENKLGRYFRNGTVLDAELRQTVDGHVIDLCFFEKLSKFEKENKKRHARAIKDKKIEAHKLAFFLSDGSTQLYDWCYRNLNDNVSFQNLWWVIRTRNKYKSRQGMLKRGSITAYNGSNDIDSLIMELKDIAINAKTVKAISSFNTAQRKILKTMNMGPKWTQSHSKLMVKFGKMPKSKRYATIKKVSCITNDEELIEAISISVGDTFLWSRKSFMAHLSGIDEKLSYKILYDKNNIIVVKVFDFNTVAYIAKATSWCITRDIDYWQNYAESPNRSQYVILNFNLDYSDEYSIVGVTTEKGSILKAAHTMTNTDLNFIPNPFLSTPRKKNVNEYLSSIGVMGAIIKNSFPHSLEGVMKMLGTNDYACIRREGGKTAIFSANCALDKLMFTLLTNQPLPKPLFYMLFFDQHSETDASKFIQAVFFHKDGISGFNSIGQGFMFDTALKLFDEYGIDPSDYIPMPTTSIGKLMMRLEAMDIDTAVSMMTEDGSILETLKQDEGMCKMFVEITTRIVTKDLSDLYLVDNIGTEDFAFCKFISGLRRKGIMIFEEVPDMLDNVISTFGVRLYNQYPISDVELRRAKRIIRYITFLEPRWRGLIAVKSNEEIVDKMLNTVKLITNEKETEDNI